MRRDAGFTSIEAVLIIALLGIASLGMAHGLLAGHRGLRHLEDDGLVLQQAQVLMSRLQALAFGSAADPLPSAWDVANLVSIENDLFGSAGAGGNVSTPNQLYGGSALTLKQLARMPQPMSWTYAVAGDAYYGIGRPWDLVVDRDLNGDGDVADAIEAATAVREDLLRIEIRYDGRRVLRTVRSREPTQ